MKPLVIGKRDELAYKQLLDNIKTGVWKSGDKLPTEMELCNELNISRGTVRAAIQKLKSLGLVESIHGKGTYVCNNEDLFDYSGFDDSIELSVKEYQDFTQLREVIEQRAILNIVESHTNNEKEEILAAYQGMENAARKFDNVELTKYDMMFHSAIILASGNQLFVQIMRIFQDEYYKVLLETNKLLLRDYPDEKKMRQHFNECLENHKGLMEALFDNPDEAIAQQHKFHERNKERVEYFFQKHEKQVSRMVDGR